jgi:hypothetical protein
VLRERSLDLGVPVVAHLPVGHHVGNAALPLGVRARLDGGTCCFSTGRLTAPAGISLTPHPVLLRPWLFTTALSTANVFRLPLSMSARTTLVVRSC